MRNTLTKIRFYKLKSLLLILPITLLFVTAVYAATQAVSLEAENASLSGGAVTGLDTNASGGGYVKFGPDGGGGVAASWQEAWDSRDQATIDAWYANNTGYEALGLAYGDLLQLEGTVLIDDAWLNSNEGNGYVSWDGSRWIVESVRADGFRIAANNVTLRGFAVERNGTGLYGVSYYGSTAFNSPNYGAILEYGTLDGGGSESIGVIMNPGKTGSDLTITRNLHVYGFRVGFHFLHGHTDEYSHVNDLYYFSGSHNTSGSIRASNVTLRRSHYEDGNSAAVSLYANDPIDNVLVTENVFNTPVANYGFNFPGDKEYADATTNTRLIDNIFGQKYFSTTGSSGPISGKQRFTTASGNAFMDGEPI